MRDFVSGFVAGLAGGVAQGAKLGLAARELRDKRENDAAVLARQTAADQATAEYRQGQLGIAGRNATTAEKRLGISRGALAETGKHNRAIEKTDAANADTNKRRADAYILKNSGVDPGLQADLAAKGLGPGGAVATPPAVAVPTAPTQPEAAGGDKSISTEEEFDAIGALLGGPDDEEPR